MRALRFAVAIAAVALSLAARPARACSVCGCDPASSTLALERPSLMTPLRAGVETRLSSKSSGEGGDAESESETRVIVRAQYVPAELPALALSLEIPLVTKQHFDAGGAVDAEPQGLGDVAASARFELWRDHQLMPKNVVSLLATATAPTGANDLKNFAGYIDEHAQLGGGAWSG